VTDEAASPEAAAVFADIRATRGTDFINNFWRALANDPALLKATWERLKTVMGKGREDGLDPLTKELLYIAVSIANGCDYCIHSHTAAAQGQGHDRGQLRRPAGRGRHGLPDQRAGDGAAVPVDGHVPPWLVARSLMRHRALLVVRARPPSGGARRAAGALPGVRPGAPDSSRSPDTRGRAADRAIEPSMRRLERDSLSRCASIGRRPPRGGRAPGRAPGSADSSRSPDTRRRGDDRAIEPSMRRLERDSPSPMRQHRAAPAARRARSRACAREHPKNSRSPDTRASCRRARAIGPSAPPTRSRRWPDRADI
jgi:AhpD family alkylhydroperoxidase